MPKPLNLNGRGGQIRTDDFLLPKQALYQAELRPVADSRGVPVEWIVRVRKLAFRLPERLEVSPE